jgi:tetratricopeptide (TPR) repeat protein
VAPKGSRPAPKPIPEVDLGELVRLVGAKRAGVVGARLSDAAAAFGAERFPEARRILKPLADEVPASGAVRELYGLTLYRLGRFREAAAQLEAFRDVTGNSTEQHPVLADCYRAQRKFSLVDELWAELRDASPSAALVTEGRIVAAGALADRGRLADAVRLLEKGWKAPKRPAEHHLRRAYVLADLYEQAGDLPRARATFSWVAGHDPGLADVVDRLAALGR